MKKIVGTTVISLLLFIFASWAVAAYFFGSQAQKQYHVMLQQAAESGYVKATERSYDRGLSGSIARTEIEIPVPDGQGASGNDTEGSRPLRFTLVHDIKHGPVPFGAATNEKLQIKPVQAIIETKLDSAPEAQGDLKEILSSIPELALMRHITTIYLAGDGEALLEVPAFNRTVGSDAKVNLDWRGLTARMTFSAGLKKMKGSMYASGFEATDEGNSLNVGGIESSFAVHGEISGVALGDMHFNVADLELVDREKGDGDHFALSNLRAEVSNSALNDALNSSFTVHVDRMSVGAAAYGPGVFELELRKLDAASWAELQRMLQEINASRLQYSESELMSVMATRFSEVLPRLVKNSPEIEIKQLGVKTNDGDATGRLKISIDGSKGAALLQPFALLSAVSVQAEASAAETLLGKVLTSYYEKQLSEEETDLNEEVANKHAQSLTVRQLDALVAEEFLVRQNGSYSAAASYRSGQIVFNGRNAAVLILTESLIFCFQSNRSVEHMDL
jgi:uncharacterized protein YdgA (DUF945 family)